MGGNEQNCHICIAHRVWIIINYCFSGMSKSKRSSPKKAKRGKGKAKEKLKVKAPGRGLTFRADELDTLLTLIETLLPLGSGKDFRQIS